MTLGGAYPSTFQHFAGDAYYIAHNSTRIGFNTFLVEKTIVCFNLRVFNRKVLFFPGIERNSQEVRFFLFSESEPVVKNGAQFWYFLRHRPRKAVLYSP
jgi:hypothetical protein